MPTLIDYWNANAPVYKEKGSRPVMNKLVEIMPRGGKAIDLFCGGGEFTCKFASATSSSIVGIEPDPALIDEARHRCRNQSLGDLVSFELGDPGSITNNNEFDLIYGENIGAHPDLVSMCRSWIKALKPEGKLILFEIAWNEMPSAEDRDHWYGLFGRHFSTTGNYISLFKTLGLKNVDAIDMTGQMNNYQKESSSMKGTKEMSRFSLDSIKLSRDHSKFLKVLKTGQLSYRFVIGSL